jgi:hypothetical protein
MSVAEFCDSAADMCPMTWTAAQDAASWRCGPGTDGFVTLSTCGDVHVATVAYIDAGKDYYYNASGQLYHIESFVNLSHECAAGTGHALPGKNSTSCDPNPVTLCSPY